MARAPQYARRFADALLAAREELVMLDIGTGSPLVARRGILTTSRIQYNAKSFNLLGRDIEYRVNVAEADTPNEIDVSLQLYENINDHWRLFAYSPAGMLFSVNLTTAPGNRSWMELGQVIALRDRSDDRAGRAARTAALRTLLTQLGFDVHGSRLVLGSFDVRSGEFLDTTASQFLSGFMAVAMLVAHFRQNKGYRLHFDSEAAEPWPASAVLPGTGRSRSVSAGLRSEVLRRDGSRCRVCGASPSDAADVRLHVDHIRPFSRNGPTTFENLQTLCATCNLGKGNRFSG